MRRPGLLKSFALSILLLAGLGSYTQAQSGMQTQSGMQAQSGMQRLDERILEGLAAGRTNGQTKWWRFVSNANNYVNAAIPVGVLMDGLIRNG